MAPEAPKAFKYGSFKRKYDVAACKNEPDSPAIR